MSNVLATMAKKNAYQPQALCSGRSPTFFWPVSSSCMCGFSHSQTCPTLQGQIQGGLGVRTPLPPPFGGPPNFIKRGKTSRVCRRKRHILVLNSYPPFPKSCIRPCPSSLFMFENVIKNCVKILLLHRSQWCLLT